MPATASNIDREWDRELEDCMTTLQEYLEKECDAYILKIKKDPVKVLINHFWWV